MISPDLIAAIRMSLPVEALAEQHTRLRPSGSALFGACPLCGGRAFRISREKQVFHCFKCGASGDVFSLAMRIHDLTFPQSVRFLADKVGIAIGGGAPEISDELRARIEREGARRRHEARREGYISQRQDNISDAFRSLGRLAKLAEKTLREPDTDAELAELCWDVIAGYREEQVLCFGRDGLLGAQGAVANDYEDLPVASRRRIEREFDAAFARGGRHG